MKTITIVMTIREDEGIRSLYVRALEHLTGRIESVKKDIVEDHFIVRDLVKYEHEISQMIQEYREGGYPGNSLLLNTALQVYKKDLE